MTGLRFVLCERDTSLLTQVSVMDEEYLPVQDVAEIIFAQFNHSSARSITLPVTARGGEMSFLAHVSG